MNAVAAACGRHELALPVTDGDIDTPAIITSYNSETCRGRLHFYGGEEMTFSCYTAEPGGATGIAIVIDGLVPSPMPFDPESVAVGIRLRTISIPQLSDARNEKLYVRLVSGDRIQIWAAATKVSAAEITFVVRDLRGEFTFHTTITGHTHDHTDVRVTDVKVKETS